VVRSSGKIDFRLRQSHTFLVHVNSRSDEKILKTRLSALPGVKTLDADEEPFDINSMKSLDRKLAHLQEDEEQENVGKVGAPKKAKADYLEAYQAFVKLRAFPNDSVDWSSFEKGRQHAAKMRRVVISSSEPDRLHAPTSNSWTFLGPTNLAVPYETYYGITPINGRVNAVAFDPTTSQTIYAGGAQGGLWKSTDSGTTWTWLSSTWTQLAVNCIAIDPNNNQTIYVGRGDYHGFIPGSYGIMKSTDGGLTWSEIAEGSMGLVGVNHILIDPTNSQTLIAGTGDQTTFTGYLWRSTNGGQNWTKIALGGQYYIWPTISASAPSGGNTRFYAVAAGYATGGGQTQRVYKSDDHGSTWQALSSPVAADGNYLWAYEVAASPTNPNNVYVLDSQHSAMYTSSNQGVSWTNVSGNLPQGPSQDPNFSQSDYDYHLECGSMVSGNTTTDVLYLGEINVNYSIDGGQTWKDFVAGGGSYYNGSVLHNDQHCLAISPTNPNLVLFSNDGGVYSALLNSTFSSGTVTRLSKNLGNTMFYHIAMHPTNPNYILGGTQDNASPLSTGDLNNWYNVGAGDGAGCAINQTNPLIQYNSFDGMGIYATTDGWAHINLIGNGGNTFSGNLTFTPTIVLDPSNQSLMYTGTNYLYRWNQTSQSWSGILGSMDLTNGNGGATIKAIAIAPSDTNRLYTGSTDGALYMSQNQGSTWTKLNPNANTLPLQAITSIVVNPSNSSDIIVGLSGAGQGSGHLYRCTNTLSSTPTFTNISGTGINSLPDVSLNAIVYINTNTFWVATDVGVFTTSNGGSSWSNGGSPLGLPNVIVDDLVMVPSTGYLNAGTYGRGAWRLQIGGFPTLSSFTISPTSVPAGGTSSGTVTLSSQAPSGGLVVNLASANTSVATVPSSVTVAQGSTTATFTINTNSSLTSPASAQISASYNGVTLNQTLSVTVQGVTSVTLSPSTVVGGNSSTGTVTLNANAPSGGTVVALQSSSTNATVPNSVTVPGGTSSTTFTVNTIGVDAAATASITASLSGTSQSATLTINPASVSTVSVSPSTVVGGSSTTVTGTVTLNGQAGPSSNVITLNSSNTAAATVPASVSVAAGTTSATFAVTTYNVTNSQSVTITASGGGATQTTTLTVNPNTVTGLTISPATVVAGTSSTGTVTISTPAGSSGTTVKLGSSGPDAQVPSTVLVPSGATTAQFNITTSVTTSVETLTITASIGSSQQSATITLNPVNLSSISVSPTSVVGGNSSTGTVTLTAAAPSVGISVNLSSGNSSVTVPPSVTVPGGATSATFTVNTTGVDASTSVTITGSLGTTRTCSLTVTAASLTSLSLSPNTVLGGSGNAVTGTVTLNGQAGPSGAVVALKSNSTIATLPSTVTVPSGSATGTFLITTGQVTSPSTPTITATFGSVAKSAGLTINPYTLTAFTLNPTTVVGGSSSTGTVTLAAAAGPNGITVNLASYNAAAQVPSTMVVPSGSTTGTFTITTTVPSSNVNALIAARIGSSALSATLTVNVPTLSSISVTPNPIVGGNTATGTVTLNGAAPSSGETVTLSSNNAAVTVPSSVTIASGASSATFSVTTIGVAAATPVTITGTLGTSTRTYSLTVNPAGYSTFTVTPSTVVGGSTTAVTGTVTLNGQAGPSGDVFTLKSNSTIAGVPSSVTIPAGSTSATFPVTCGQVTSNSTPTITATYGSVAKSQTITITPYTVTGFTLSPTTVVGGNSATGTITISQVAGPNGINVSAASYSSNAQVPSTVTVPSGASSVNFTITTNVVTSNTSAFIAVRIGASAQSATLGINIASLNSVTVNPTTVVGGNSSTGTVTLNGNASGAGVVVSLQSNNSATQVPSSVTVPAGSSSATFPITTSGVASTTATTITGTVGASVHTATLTLTMANLSTLTLSPTTVYGGSSTVVTGTVSLNGQAAPSGTVVTLKSNSTAAAVPASVTVPAGSSSATFTVTTSQVTSVVAPTISAAFNSISKNAVLTINPYTVTSLTLDPPTVVGGNSSTGTVTLGQVAGPNGITVSLASYNANAQLPSTVVVPSGQSSVTFTVTTNTVTSNVNALLAARIGSSAQSATLAITAH